MREMIITDPDELDDFHVAVDLAGHERLYIGMPVRDGQDKWITPGSSVGDYFLELKPGTIRKALGHPLTWNDEPVPVKLKVA